MIQMLQHYVLKVLKFQMNKMKAIYFSKNVLQINTDT